MLAFLPGYDDNVANEDQRDKWEVWYYKMTIEFIKEYYNKNKHLGIIYMKRVVLIVIMGSSKVIMCSKCVFATT